MPTRISHSSTPPSLSGVVVSDLHLFARRSDATRCLASIEDDLDQAGVLVLNGDTFDFRWSTMGHHDDTLKSAIAWVENWARKRPHQEIHLILGNHDCLDAFVGELDALTEKHPRLSWHPIMVQLGEALFIHGECANGNMNENRLQAYRSTWRRDRVRGPRLTAAYACADRFGLTRLTHELWYPRSRTVRRVTHFLDRALPGWRDSVHDCYFGHTHMPFQDYNLDGIRFHNTGSAIKGMGFNPLPFQTGNLEEGTPRD